MEPYVRFPYITIEYCTQCKWLLRAAYFAQELLSTFSTALGEVALRPSTGGTFVVEIFHTSDGAREVQKHILWDRKVEGGFPETKELKRRVRDIIDPTRNLGHVDGHSKATPNPSTTAIETNSSSSYTSQLPENSDPAPMETPIPKAINRLQASGKQAVGSGERKFTPMDVDDVDVNSRPVSRNEDEEVVDRRGKIVIRGDDDMGFCRPGDEECG